MKPKKAKEFIPDVAQELNLPQETVEAVLRYYWERVRKSLSSLEHTRVHLTNLGDFSIKHWKLDEKIDVLEKFEERCKLKGMQQITARYKTAETLYDMKKLKGFMEEETQRRDFIKLHKRNTYESKKQPNTNLEEQGSDCRGNKE